MTGQQLKATWIGNRAELLTIYALSSIAAVTHVRRENDFGFDLLCTLLTRQENVLRAGQSFGIQVKSSSKTGKRYGGLNKSKRNKSKRKWKGYEIEWLFNQDQPILIAIADVKKCRVRLYSTCRIWYLLCQIGLNIGEVVLMPDEELASGELKTQSNQWRYKEKSLETCSDGTRVGNGFSYQVPLGEPIIELSTDNDEENYVDEIMSTLDKWLDLEYANILQRKLGIPSYSEWKSWQSNQPPETDNILRYTSWDDVPGANISTLLTAVSPAIESLLLHLRHQNNFDQVQTIVPLAHWLKEENLLKKAGLDALRDIESQKDTNV